jgi:hypothetical protein
MKICSGILSFLLPAMIAWCSATNQKVGEGPVLTVAKFQDGVLCQVSGVDFWDRHGPDREYQILGVMDDAGGCVWTSTDHLRRKEALWVRNKGGNAAIVSNERERAYRYRNGTVRYRWITKVVAIKYLEKSRS